MTINKKTSYTRDRIIFKGSFSKVSYGIKWLACFNCYHIYCSMPFRYHNSYKHLLPAIKDLERHLNNCYNKIEKQRQLCDNALVKIRAFKGDIDNASK